MLNATAKFAASINFVHLPRWLTLCGPSGIGKTHLARAAWKQFMEWNRFEVGLDRYNNHIFGNTGAFKSWRKVCAGARDGGFGEIEDMGKEWFLVLDDIGAERDKTGFTTELLDRVLSERRHKWTLITTNLPLEEIANRMDRRIADRMLREGNEVIESNTTSYVHRER